MIVGAAMMKTNVVSLNMTVSSSPRAPDGRRPSGSVRAERKQA
jgi:hypothetical protein